jgi:SAM-dependent methyltransferase
MVNVKGGIDDWDRHWEDIEYSVAVNPARPYRHRLVVANLAIRNIQACRILDIGSGDGDLLTAISAQYSNVPKLLGLELSQSGIEVAKRRVPHATFLQRDLIAAQDGPGPYQHFGTHAVCSEVLEHVDDPVRLLKNARSYMAEGCRLVVTVPGGPRSAFDLHIGHRRHFTPDDLRNILVEAGFTVERSVGAGFPFFNLYRLLVVMRGQQLLKDTAGKPSFLLRSVSTVFRVLFKFNLDSSALGWQIVAVAIK